MNKREAGKLARQIEREDPQCHVTGTRVYIGIVRKVRSYALDVVDTRTGVSFVVQDAKGWEGRKQGVQDNLNDLAQYEAAE